MNPLQRMIAKVKKAARKPGKPIHLPRYRPVTRRLGDWASGDGNPFYDESFTWPDVYASIRHPELLGDGEPKVKQFADWDEVVGQGEKIDQTYSIDPAEMERQAPASVDWSKLSLSTKKNKPIVTPTNMLIVLGAMSVGFFSSSRRQLERALVGGALGVGAVFGIRAFQ